jgi:hypothetical protein
MKYLVTTVLAATVFCSSPSYAGVEKLSKHESYEGMVLEHVDHDSFTTFVRSDSPADFGLIIQKAMRKYTNFLTPTTRSDFESRCTLVTPKVTYTFVSIYVHDTYFKQPYDIQLEVYCQRRSMKAQGIILRFNQCKSLLKSTPFNYEAYEVLDCATFFSQGDEIENLVTPTFYESLSP